MSAYIDDHPRRERPGPTVQGPPGDRLDSPSCHATLDRHGTFGEPLEDGTAKAGPADTGAATAFVTEAEAYRRYGHVLQDKELRHARQEGRLGYLRRKKTVFYRRDELAAFVAALLDQDYVEPCQTPRKIPLPPVTAPATLPAPAAAPGRRPAPPGLTPEVLRGALAILAENRPAGRGSR